MSHAVIEHGAAVRGVCCPGASATLHVQGGELGVAGRDTEQTLVFILGAVTM